MLYYVYYIILFIGNKVGAARGLAVGVGFGFGAPVGVIIILFTKE